MFNNKLYLTANICILPFVIFYNEDCIEKLSKIEDIRIYNRELYKNYDEIYKTLNNYTNLSDFDEVNLLFNKFYRKSEINKNKNNIAKYYMEILSKLSKSFISHRDGKIVFKYWESEGEEEFIGPYKGLNKIAFWNYLNRLFTTDLLVVKYLLDNGMNNERNLEGFSSTILLADSQLEKVLNKGVAETHIHKNAAINFYISWQDLMNLSGKNFGEYEKKVINNLFYNEIDLPYYVIAVAIVRLLMADFLIEETIGNWDDYIKQKCSVSLKRLCDAIKDSEIISKSSYDFKVLWELTIDVLNIKEDNIDNPRSFKDDILRYVFMEYKNKNIIMENILLFKAINYIENSNDRNFGKVFINYIRIKNKVLQSNSQSNSIKGLDNFKRYFKRSTSKTYKFEKPYDHINYWKIIIQNQLYNNSNVRKLELRAGIDKGNVVEIKRSLKKTVKNFLNAYKEILEEYKQKEHYPEIALVFHLSKTKDEYVCEKCWVNFNENEYKELHFIEHRQVYINQVRAINELRNEIPGLSDYIVGIDAASSENDTEPWVFAPVYEVARDSSCTELFYNNKHRIKSLGFTFHVGEEFRHILTGLRRIDEVIDNFKFHSGDRIGHGIALGVDIEKWIKNNKVVVIPRIEYMENLLWIWGIYKDGYYNDTFDIFYLEQEIMKLAENIYCNIEGITIYSLWKAYKQKFKEFKPNRELIICNSEEKLSNRVFCKYAREANGIVWTLETLTHAAHCKCYLEKMIEPIQIEVTFDKLGLFKQLQKIVCNKVSTRAIIIETNPTSNLAIGQIESIFEHYIYNLNNKGLSREGNIEKSLMVTINSDDPSVFNTSVSNEFAYIFYSLQEKGFDRENILEWINKIRKCGLESSFIADRSMSLYRKTKEIEHIIEALES